MCSFAGFINFQHDMCSKKEILSNMTKALAKHGANEENFYFDEHINLECCEQQPMTFSCNENTYVVVFTGQLYNSKELQKELIDNGHKFRGDSNAEIVLKSYIEWR